MEINGSISSNCGLSSTEARDRLRAEGPNALPIRGSRSEWRIVADVLREPMLALLLAGGVAYMLLGSLIEALVLVCFASFSIAVTIIQESRTEHVLRSLRGLAAPRAIVIRDGATQRIPGCEVVRGDFMLLSEGDRVAADGMLLEARDLSIDESLLTGESVPVTKRARSGGEDVTALRPGGDALPIAYSGTMVTRGEGLMQVTAIGAASEIGRIGQSLAMLQIEAPGLRRQTMRIVRVASVGAGTLTLLVIILFGFLRGDWLQAVLAGIAIGMSLLPEEFPVVLTVFLAMGAWRISRAGVLTRRAAAIETLGAATMLCADKTGTLTVNHMTVAELWRPDAGISPAAAADDGSLVLLDIGALASAVRPTDPMEIALHEARAARGARNRDGWTLHYAYPLSSDLLAMSNAWRSGAEDRLVIAAKGAPEAIARLCRLAEPERSAMERATHAMAERGVRVLGVAQAHSNADSLSADQLDHAFELLGLIGLSDPLRPDVPAAVAQCRSAGVRVMMITGDLAATARAIAAQAGLAAGSVLTGAEIDTLSDAALAERLRTVSVCARTMPEQKLRIVTALKAAGEIVAMTGDGVNDAPALKSANIGIAMGKRGTDVAREAASIVLVHDDFGAIVAAIRLGRRIYDNLRKAMGFIFSVHVPIAGLALLPLVTGLPILFGPVQIALLEMVIDPVCALVFEAEAEEDGIMQRPPRRADQPLFSIRMIAGSVMQGGIAFVLLAALFLGATARGITAEHVRALIFFALLAAVLVLVLVNRAFSRSLADALLRHNIVFRYVLASIAAVSAIILGSTGVQRLLQFAPPGLVDLGIVAIVAAALLGALEWAKRGARSAET
jgi:Ca2+-transporting ATPase